MLCFCQFRKNMVQGQERKLLPLLPLRQDEESSAHGEGCVTSPVAAFVQGPVPERQRTKEGAKILQAQGGDAGGQVRDYSGDLKVRPMCFKIKNNNKKALNFIFSISHAPVLGSSSVRHIEQQTSVLPLLICQINTVVYTVDFRASPWSIVDWFSGWGLC